MPTIGVSTTSHNKMMTTYNMMKSENNSMMTNYLKYNNKCSVSPVAFTSPKSGSGASVTKQLVRQVALHCQRCALYSVRAFRDLLTGSLKINTALEYSTRVVEEGGRRCKKSFFLSVFPEKNTVTRRQIITILMTIYQQ